MGAEFRYNPKFDSGRSYCPGHFSNENDVVLTVFMKRKFILYCILFFREERTMNAKEKSKQLAKRSAIFDQYPEAFVEAVTYAGTTNRLPNEIISISPVPGEILCIYFLRL